ncbi:PH domain-containing protein, partial [Agromyces seonyuensis]
MPDSSIVRYRSRWSRVLVGITIGVCVAGALGLVVSGELQDLWGTLPFLALVSVLAWALYWRPELVVLPHGVRVVNVLRTVEVAWPAITDVDTRFALTIDTVDGRVSVWAAPAPGLRGAGSISRDRVQHLPETAQRAAGAVRP